MNDWQTLLAAFFVAIVGTGRLTRLITEDDYPPVAWVRHRWKAAFQDSTWSELATCPFCAAPYIAAITVAWGWLSNLHWAWWAFYSWLTIAYLAAILVARDIPNAE